MVLEPDWKKCEVLAEKLYDLLHTDKQGISFFEYVRTCTYFFYMHPNIYGKSKGALIELKYAKKLKKIIYDDINQVPFKKREKYALHR